MIVADITRTRIKINGHALFGAPGQDIVCAGVSALVETLIQSIEELTPDEIKYSMQPGTVDIEFEHLSERGRLLVNAFSLGVQLIEYTHPENVKVTKH